MADYRRRLIDMTDEERAAVAPGSPSFDERYENVDDPLSVQMMEAGLDFTPVGIVKGVSDIKDELSEDDPNYLKALGMTAIEAAGIIPGARPVLKGMVKGTFKTSKGSVYDVFDDSTTVRNRAERGDSESVGIQPRSGKTIYMTREGVDELGSLFQNTEIPVQFVPVKGDKAKLVYTQDYGPKKAGMDASSEVPYTLDPEIGLHPVEILDSRNTNRRNIHFGNDITVVESNVPSTKGTNKQVSNTEYDARMAQLDEAPDAATWQKNTKKFVKESRDVNPTVRTPELESSTMDLIDGKITREQHLNNVDKFKPVDAWDALPREPSDKATVFSLKPNQRKDGFFVLPEAEAKRLGVVKSVLAVGQRFLGRLDIPAYKDYDTWIVAGKSPKGEKGTVYAKAIHYGSEDGKPVVFRASQGKSEKIGKGKADPEYTPETHEKTGYATVDGIVQDLDVDSIRAKAVQYLNDPEWTQVGFDPRRQGGFYVRAGENKHVPIREASEVIQIGPLVLARNAKLDFEHTGYAEGGAVMDKQMEMAFGEQPEVDPVSGNEVPTGSLPEEVRDDIPAQLSEGEYVVPADVVRFFGVKFFEDIRAEAKRGFAAMEANGRIGGEPIGMEMGGDELPFDISELQIVDDGMPEQPTMNKGGYISGYAPGGLVDTGDIPLTEENYQGTGMEQRQYTNATGNIITILFFNGMPMSAVPDGYSPYTPDAVPSEAKSVVNDDDGGFDTSTPDPEPIDYKGLSASELRDLVDAQKDTNRNAIALGLGMLNPLMGMAFKAATWHQSKQVTKELERRMEDPSLDAKQKAFYTDLTETMTADQPGLFERLFGKTEEAKKPEVKPGVADPVMTPEEITDTVEAALAYTPEEGYVPTGMTPVEAPSPITVTSLDDEPGARDYKGPLAPTVSSDTDDSDDSGPSDIFADAASKADEGTAKVVKAAQKSLATESEISDIQKEGAKIKEKLESSAKGGGRGFSGGGLASKPKKKKK